MSEIRGLHHVTAIAGNPQVNVDFYASVLGLNLVKLTVNFDDPGTYHLYYGDQIGRPGTIMTFFPWAAGTKGADGAGQAAAVSFLIREESLAYWTNRLKNKLVKFDGPFQRFGEEVLAFRDPDGIRLALVAQSGLDHREDHAIIGFHSVTLWEANAEVTAQLLSDVLGFRLIGQQSGVLRFEVGGAGPGSFIDIVGVPSEPRGFVGVGSVHHLAWRTADYESQNNWRERILDNHLNVTPVIDRKYFRSIYFREPGGVLFEIATDPPGFTVDEPAGKLGRHLMLPEWLEPNRADIELRLPPLHIPMGKAA